MDMVIGLSEVKRSDLQEALENPNVRAFLHAIRLGEGTSDEAGYLRIVGGDMASHYIDHPRAMRYIKRYKVWSSAAGAYQIIGKTWDGLVKQYGFQDFSPQCQDEAAVALIAEKRALRHVKNGDIAKAIALLGGVWASLPSSTDGQLTEPIQAVLAEYEKYGGTLNASAGMQKHYIDQKLFGPAEQPPAEPQGHTFKGQVGTTVMPPDQEAQLRGMLRARGLSAAQIDAMVAAHKAAKGLR